MNSNISEKTPAITCKAVWQVFGDEDGSKLRTALESCKNDQAKTAQQLLQSDCVPAVRDVSFDVYEGELFVIMGLSGSGKSTLIRCISNLIQATSGEILIEGENIRTATKQRMIELRRKKLGMVFQHFGLFPHMTVTENVAFPLKVQGQSAKSRLDRAIEVIELVGLKGREESFPREMSGGQRQRVGIARSLAVNPDIWFLDEPFSALDPLIRRQLQDEFLNIQATLRKSIVFITHDIAEALKIADRIAIMRDGEIVQIGTPSEIVLNPVDGYVREFSKDVAKGKHARLSSIMNTEDLENIDTSDDPGLKSTMTIDDALAYCMSLYDPVPVRNENGEVVGKVNPKDMAAALQTEEA